MPNFNFKSQFPIADVIAAAQRKPQMEAEMKRAEEQTRNDRLKTLLDTLSTGAQVSRVISQNKNEALARQKEATEMEGQAEAQAIHNEPGMGAPVMKPFTQYQRGVGADTVQPDGSTVPPAPEPIGMVQPTFGDTEFAARQPDRLKAALLKGYPSAGYLASQEAFADPLTKRKRELDIQVTEAELASGGIEKDPKSLEQHLAREVAAGRMTLDEALAAKAKGNAVTIKPLSSEGAGRASAVTQALSELKGVRNLIFPNGKFDRAVAIGAQWNIPSTKTQLVRNRMSRAIQAKMRLDTGATAPQTEIDQYMSDYLPGGFDTPIAAEDKIKSLEDVFTNYTFFIDPEGKMGRKPKSGATGEPAPDLSALTPEELIAIAQGGQ